MANFAEPIAISGVQSAEKIRSVIFSNNRLAHLPLTKILDLAVQTDQDLTSNKNAHQDKRTVKNQRGGEKASLFPEQSQKHFIRLGNNLLIQYGYQHNLAGEEEKKTRQQIKQPQLAIQFSKQFADCNYMPLITPSCPIRGNINLALTVGQLQTTGFIVQNAPNDQEILTGVYWLAIGRAQ